jgi:hypothetical protein
MSCTSALKAAFVVFGKTVVCGSAAALAGATGRADGVGGVGFGAGGVGFGAGGVGFGAGAGRSPGDLLALGDAW